MPAIYITEKYNVHSINMILVNAVLDKVLYGEIQASNTYYRTL